MTKRAEIRYEQLDGLRGLAAFVVFLFHAVMMAQPDSQVLPILNRLWIRPLWDGPGAVMLFFVLSGFVLTLPYVATNARKLEPIPFIIRRIARLYPAYWAALTLALALRFLAFDPHGLSGLSPWVKLHWSQPIGATSIISHTLMIFPNIQVDQIDPVIWSLIIEMKVSLFFPLSIMLVTRTTKMIYGLIAVVIGIALTMPLHFVTHSSSSWSRAAIMLPVFILGSYLARYRSELVSRLRTSRWIRLAVATAGAVLYSIVWIVPPEKQSLARWGSALGSGAFVLLFLSSARLQSIGTARSIQFLGRVSYSFYLIHLPILITIASLLFPRTHSLGAVTGISLIFCLLTAWVFNSLIEVPAHNWGKMLASQASAAVRTKAAESVAS